MGFGDDEEIDEADFYCEDCEKYDCQCAEDDGRHDDAAWFFDPDDIGVKS